MRRILFWMHLSAGVLVGLDNAAQRVNRDMPSNPAAVQLTGIYHNLLRQWAEV